MPEPEVGKVPHQFHGPNSESPDSSGVRTIIQFRPNPESTQISPHSRRLATLGDVSVPEPSPNLSSAFPAQPVAVKRSRQRPTKSCERCRAKKLKCDRELPCSNCKKGGRDGSDCDYRFGSNEEDGSPIAKRAKSGGQFSNNGSYHQYSSPQTAPNVIAGQNVPVPDWPSYANGNAGPNAWLGQPSPVASQAVSSVSTPLGTIDVKGTRSRYIGIGDKQAMLDHFEHSKSFIMKAFQDPEVSSMMQELSTFQRHYAPRHRCRPDIVIPFDHQELMAEMLQSLPSGFLFGLLQVRYVSNWETLVRILHIPTFTRECDQLQDARRAEPMTTLPSHIPDWVVPQVLAVLAIGSRLRDPNQKSMNGEELTDEMITKICLMVQRWLDNLHGKITLTFQVLQTRALLLLARQSNLSHPSELFRRSGDLVRVALTMGLHKDPEDCDQIAKLQKEMRRKLWNSIVEMDIQFALAAGMPASVTSTTFNIRSLINVDDEELPEDMQIYPTGKGEAIWTDATAQIAITASLRDRLNTTNLLGGCLDLDRDASTLLLQTKILENTLRSLPDQFRSSTRAGNANNKRMHRLFASIMLDMSIRRPLLALYRTIAMSPQASQYPEARKGALRCSLAILSHLDALDPAIADVSTVKSRDYLNLFHLLCKSDILQAALTVCFEIRSFNASPSSSSESNEASISSDEQFPQMKHSLTRVVENTLESILQRLGEFGSDLKDILPLAIVLQSVRSDGTQEEMRESMIRGAERVLKACRKVMPSIEDAALLNSVARGNDNTQQQTAPILPPSWQPGLDTSLPQSGQSYGGYGGPQTFGDFNMIPGDLNFGDFDLGFGFTDWDLNQYWL